MLYNNQHPKVCCNRCSSMKYPTIPKKEYRWVDNWISRESTSRSWVILESVAKWSFRCGQGNNSLEMEGIMTIWSSFTFVLGSSAVKKCTTNPLVNLPPFHGREDGSNLWFGDEIVKIWCYLQLSMLAAGCFRSLVAGDHNIFEKIGGFSRHESWDVKEVTIHQLKP